VEVIHCCCRSNNPAMPFEPHELDRRHHGGSAEERKNTTIFHLLYDSAGDGD
jgi:hypothetical protein